ncbi:MAG: protein-disulfide reductase DsbD [Pigmentiphaga sp.]|nr:protein-disulfide reductase DsbD [Pigmentiphaga sp.]
MWRLLALLFLTACWLAVASPTARAMSESDFLPPEQAFRMQAQALPGDVLEVSFAIEPGYYLYHDPFAFAAEPDAAALGAAEIPRGEVIYDAVFEKDLETHRGGVAIRLPLAGEPRPLTVQVTSQGCAEAGLCYPPQTWPIKLAAAGGGWSAHAAVPSSGWSEAGSSTSFGGWGGTGSGLGFSGWRDANDLGLADALAGAAVWQTAGVFFLLGVLLSLTPCVLPMLPILSSLLVGDQAARSAQGQASGRWRGLSLAASYVFGMSLVYTAAGVAAGLTGASLAATLQTPWVLGVFAACLALLALAMFDVFTVQVPGRMQTALSSWVNRLPGGRITGAFGMGAISALIVGPCVAAPLAGALIYISQTGDVWLGGTALFFMAWGMGVSLLLAGASASTWLPRAGAWMNGVKQFFGILLLVVAWWLLLPVLPAWVQMAGWALLAFFAASLLGAFSSLPAAAGVGARLSKGMGWVLVLVGAVEIVGLASGGRDVLQPLAHWTAAPATGVAVVAPGAGPRAAPSLVAQGGAPSPKQARVDSSWLTAAGPSAGGAVGMNGGDGIDGSGVSGDITGLDEPDGLSGMIGAGIAPMPPVGVPGRDRQPAAHGGQPSPLAASGPDRLPVVESGPLSFVRIDSVAELDALVARSRGWPVMLDFYADWCVSCKEMERFTFSDPAVAQRMSQMVLVQADVTANNADHQALLRRFRLFGPPGIIFFDSQGREQTATRVIGFQNAERFGAVLDRVLGG